MHSKLYHVRFDALADAKKAAKQLTGVAGVEVVGVSQSHGHGPNILVLRLSDGVTIEELLPEANALLFSDATAEDAGRVVPVMNEGEDGSENV